MATTGSLKILLHAVLLAVFICSLSAIAAKTKENTANVPILENKNITVEDTTDFAFRTESVDTHNLFRGRHQETPMLKENPDLVASAQARCKYFAIQERFSQEVLAFGKSHGENLWIGWSSVAPTSQNRIFATKSVIESWYSEGTHYTYDYPGWTDRTGHFTMMMWKSTIEVGCARCVATKKDEKDAKTFVVCHYRPAGNQIGKFKANVMPLA